MLHPLLPEPGGDLVVYVAPDVFALLRPGPGAPRRLLVVTPNEYAPGVLTERLQDTLAAYRPLRVLVFVGQGLAPDSALAQLVRGSVDAWEATEGVLLHYLPDLRPLTLALTPSDDVTPPRGSPPTGPPTHPVPVENTSSRQTCLFPTYAFPTLAPLG